MRVRNVGMCAVLIAGIACGALSVAIAHAEPAYSFAGELPVSFAGEPQVRATAELLAGWALLAVGLVAWVRRGSGFGTLLVAALVRLVPPRVEQPGHRLGARVRARARALRGRSAARRARGARLPRPATLVRLDRLVLAAAYAGAVLVLGLVPALVFDPAARGAARECPRNLLLVERLASPLRLAEPDRRPGRTRLVARARRCCSSLRLVESTPALRRLLWPVLVPAAAYLALVAWTSRTASTAARSETTRSTRDLWLGEAAALVALALGVVWGWLRARHTRSAVARLVVEVAASPAPGGLREMLARTLARPVARARLSAGGRRARRCARPAGRARGRGDAARPRRARPSRCCRTARACSTIPALVEEVAAAARLALENERLQAEVAGAARGSASVAGRVIATGDAERRRLERDLHDGAQQRLVGLSLALGLARSRLGPDAGRRDRCTASTRPRPSSAPHSPSCASSATGSSRALLAEEGLAAALEALTEEAPVEIEIGALPRAPRRALSRRPAYFVVSEALRRSAGASRHRLAARTEGDLLVVEVEADIAAERDRRPRGSRRRARRHARGRTRGRRAGENPRGDPVRVVIADDEVLLREGLERLLQRPASTSSARSAPRTSCCARSSSRGPDVAIVDIRMPPTHTDEGLVAAQEIRESHPRGRRARALALPRVALRDAADRAASRRRRATC